MLATGKGCRVVSYLRFTGLGSSVWGAGFRVMRIISEALRVQGLRFLVLFTLSCEFLNPSSISKP